MRGKGLGAGDLGGAEAGGYCGTDDEMAGVQRAIGLRYPVVVDP